MHLVFWNFLIRAIVTKIFVKNRFYIVRPMGFEKASFQLWQAVSGFGRNLLNVGGHLLLSDKEIGQLTLPFFPPCNCSHNTWWESNLSNKSFKRTQVYQVKDSGWWIEDTNFIQTDGWMTITQVSESLPGSIVSLAMFLSDPLGTDLTVVFIISSIFFIPL